MQGNHTGNHAGNYAGNHTGNHTGNHAGNCAGNHTGNHAVANLTERIKTLTTKDTHTHTQSVNKSVTSHDDLNIDHGI